MTPSPTLMTLDNNWETFWSRDARLALVGGVVHFYGSISGGTSTTIDTLPTSMRPPATVRVVADVSGPRQARLLIEPSGVVKVTGVSLSTAAALTSLDGASFAF